LGLTEEPDRTADALLAARLLAAHPGRFGGLWLRGGGEDVRADIIATVGARLPCRKLPLTIDEDRLSGGLDLAATLAAGRSIRQAGLLEEMRRGVLIVPGAERLTPAMAGRIAAAMDEGGPALILFDDGTEDERPPACLTERVAFHLFEPEEPAQAERPESSPSPSSVEAKERQCTDKLSMDGVGETSEAHMTALAAAAAALGIASARADTFALRAARAHAALNGRAEVAEPDLAFAARTILAARATQLAPEPAEAPPEPAEAPDQPGRNTETLEDRVLEAARAALPDHLLAALAAGTQRSGRGGHGQGGRQRCKLRGRPLGARAGLPRGGARLALIDTLRAAAPWQALRRRGDPSRRLHLRRDDLRIRRFEERSPTLTIFAVDASGSAAAARLAEAKGAVELLLQQSYARRAEVALLAFRGTTAELLLPPTRSLTRARRLLGDLPGGGGTPLAAGMDAARLVAEAAAARGRTPTLVVLTDGRANIAADGSQGRPAAQADAVAAARRIAQSGLTALLIDIGARAQPEAASLAKAMAARYLHLPRADAGAVHAALDA
jgi:magnesium chelatase subunit D